MTQYTTIPSTDTIILARVETNKIYSHQYENEYYVTKIYKEYVKDNKKFIRNIVSYHFKMKRCSLVEEGKRVGIKRMQSCCIKKIADRLIERKREMMLWLVVQKIDEIGIERECIRKIMRLVLKGK
jgi:flavodoxin